jgi:hypothetical protein
MRRARIPAGMKRAADSPRGVNVEMAKAMARKVDPHTTEAVR